MTVKILIGDCVQRMGELPDNSVDSVVCDPPYHLTSGNLHYDFAREKRTRHEGRKPSKGFMGQTWDGGDVAFRPETWAEVLRVLKPGGHLVAFSGTRTYHRMAVAIEDAGFEIRDQLAWIYGSGFPKSHNLGDGWGTALKPAWEPIALCRKPLQGTNAANMAKHGVGGLNIGACRIDTADNLNGGAYSGEKRQRDNYSSTDTDADAPLTRLNRGIGEYEQPEGRWPANIIHDGSDEVVAGFPETDSGGGPAAGTPRTKANTYGEPTVSLCQPKGQNSGSAARFFYCGKATAEERGEGNNHPTVKPRALMQWLVRLVTPKGGLVLDPFMGSGSTALACDAEQMDFIGCELSPEYAAIAEARIRRAAGMFAAVETSPRPIEAAA